MRQKIMNIEIYRSLLTIMTVAIGVQIVTPFAAKQITPQYLFAAALISLCIFLSLYLTRGKGKLIAGVIAGAVFLTLFLFQGAANSIRFLEDYVDWLFNRGEWNQDGILNYQFLNIVLIGFIICFFTLLIERIFALKGVMVFLLTSFLIVLMIQGRPVSKLMVCMILLFDILFVIEWIQTYGEAQKDPMRIRVAVWLIPFFILYFAGILMVPTDKEAYDWKFVKNVYEQLQKVVNITLQRAGQLIEGSNEEFGISFAGFSEDGKIREGAAAQEKEVMLLTTGSDLKTNIYLTGRISDTFDGKEWFQRSEDRGQGNRIDFMETMYAIERFDGENAADFVWGTNMTVYYTGITTKHLFTPLKTWEITSSQRKFDITEQEGEILFSKKHGYGTTYQTCFIQMNVDQPFFYEMVKQESEYTYSTTSGEEPRLLKQLNKKYPQEDLKINPVTEEMLAQNAKRIHEQYLQPYEISENVKVYVDNLTKDCRGTLEKLKAIEEALGQFTYTTSPKQIPKGEDFLNYFLLESKEGYCTYFATAFVLLARYEGVPARYVQGFCVPANQKGTNEITVTSSMAHAWPEVYLEGIGWIPFEPTPSYAQIRYTPWKPKNRKNMAEAKTGYFAQDERKLTEESISQIPLEAETEMKGDNLSTFYKMLSFLFILIFLGISLVFIIEFILRRKRYEKMPLQDKISDNTKKNVKILKYLGYDLQQGETLWELSQRMQMNKSIFEQEFQFIKIFEGIKYGNYAAGEEMLVTVMKEQKILLAVLKNAKKWKYFFYRLQMGV